MTTQSIEIVGTRQPVDPDEVSLIVDDREFRGWTSARVTCGIEHFPRDFVLGLTETFPNATQYLDIRPGQRCELFLGRSRVITGFVERVMPGFGPGSHTIEISGRGACADLVDCMAEWPGSQIRGASVLEVARKLAAPFNIDVNGEAGPPVGGGGSDIIPQLVLMIGETPWEIIERLCRIAGLLVFDQPDGSLRLAANPAVTLAGLTAKQGGFALAANGFAEGVNVTTARTMFSMDQRYSVYRGFQFPFDRLRDAGIGDDANLVAEFKDEGVPRYRPHAVLMELDKAQGYDNLFKRTLWEAKRRWGRSYVASVTTDTWRDSAGALYSPNTLAPVDLPTLKIDGPLWLISEVTYHLDAGGTRCDVTLMPPPAFDVQPTLPPFAIPIDIARQAPGLGRP